MSQYLRLALCTALAMCLMQAAALAGSGKQKKTVGQLISECMQEIEKGRTAGRKMSQQQRMVAEGQCRARAEAEIAAQGG
jgi:hypothetical protein